MIDSYVATKVIIGFLIIFGIVIPILDRIPKVRDFISFRWLIVIVYSALCLGVIVDFGHLDTSVRFAVVVGGVVLSAIFLLVRSIEKAAYNKWSIPKLDASVKKGDVSAELKTFSDMPAPELNKEHAHSDKDSDDPTKE